MHLDRMEAFSPRPCEATPAEPRPSVDRRHRVRVPVRWPVVLFLGDGSRAIETVTQDLSSAGFFCLSPARVTAGETLTCTLRLPTFDPTTQEPYVPVMCRAMVVRVQVGVDGSYGVACQILDYHLL